MMFLKKSGGLNRSVQHWLGVYLRESQSPRFFADVDLGAASRGWQEGTPWVETPIGWTMLVYLYSTMGPLRLSQSRTPMLGPSTGSVL